MSDDALILRTVEETEPLNNKRGVTYRVQVVGGGGSVDYSKTVQKTTTMPTADSSNAGDVYMYTGATDANYTTNYIYENITTTTPSSASATQTVGSSLSDISVDIDTLESFTGWTTDNSLQIFYTADGWSVDTTSLGVTYTGTPSVGDAITITYTAEVNTYAWTRVDVQPAPSGLPDQTGNSGKFLTTDGTAASWAAISALQNTATGPDSLTILGTATTASSVVNIGKNSVSTGIRAVCVGENSQVTKSYGVAIGYNAQTAVSEGVAIGQNATLSSNGILALGSGCNSKNYGCAIGRYADVTGTRGIAIGDNAKASANNAIQLGGYYQTNSDANTFKVGNANGNYEMMSADGTIPTARLTKVNTTITLAAADWNGGTTVTKAVSGVTSTSVVLVAPDPSDTADYVAAGILCTSQTTDSLTFTATTTPTNDIDVNIVCL